MSVLADITKEIKENKLKPVYAFDGEESYFIDELVDLFEEHALQAHERDFNQTILYGKDSTWTDVVNACRSYPAFAERRIVIVKEASQLKNFAELDRYVSQPLPSTTLVIAHKYKKIDGRTALLKSIKKQGFYATFDKLREEKVPAWILDFCQHKKLKINGQNATLLAAYLGNDLQKIANEIGKIIININPGEEITAELIEKYIGISKEYNMFEFPKTILMRDMEKSFRIANYYISNPKASPLVVIASMLYREFSRLYAFHYAKNMQDKDIAAALKVSPYFVKDYRQYANSFSLAQTGKAILLIQEFNLNSIGMNTAHNDHGLLKELTVNLLSL